MLTKRIVARLELDSNGKLIKTPGFEGCSPTELIDYYNEHSADEIYFFYNTLNIDDYITSLKSCAESNFIPLTAGGKIKHIADFKLMYEYGADKVSLGDTAIDNPQLITSAAKTYGDQGVVVTLSAGRLNGKYMVFKEDGTPLAGVNVGDWAAQLEALGAGELIVRCLDNGPNTALFELIEKQVNLPVLAACKDLSRADYLDTLALVDGIVLSHDFWKHNVTIPKLKNYFGQNGLRMRIEKGA